jgi:putative membrane protein insertion efficiency factor
MRQSILNIVKFYQIFISPVLGKNCRFYPSCSEYAYLTIEKYGIKKGLWLGIKRILKCNQWFQGGVDLPR